MSPFYQDPGQTSTMAGLSSARARGRTGGRPAGLSKEALEKACAAEALYKQGELSCDKISKQIGISKTTLYKYLKERKVKIGAYQH